MIRILTKNGVDNTNVDGARDHNFNAGRRSGIVQGALNQGNFFASNNNTIALDTCELRLCGHRIVLDKAEYRTFTNKPSVPVRYSFVARVVVDSDDNVSFEFVSKEATTQLVQDNLDITGSGTYELEIGKFTQLTDGNITDVVRTADLITGGAGGGDSDYIRIGTVTTNKISPELDADVDIENTINPTDNKPQTNFTFNLPTPSGTVVSVDGEEKTSINTDTTPTANSNNLITSGGVHDYPAIAFAESERQKSKNLLNYEDIIPTTGLTTDNNGTFYIDTTFYYIVRQLNISFEPNKTYTMSCNVVSITGGNNPTFEFAVRYKDGEWAGYGSDIITGAGIVSASFTPTKEVDLFELRFIRQSTTGQELQATINNLQIEECSVATDYQPYNGAIVHEKDVADVEHIETIYDMSSSDANINWGYTSGIIFKTQTILNKDFTKYKKLRFLCNWNHHGNGWFSKLVYFDVSLDKVTPDNVYHGYLSMTPCNASDNNETLSLQLFGRIEINNVKTALSIHGYKINVAESTRVVLDDTTNLPYFRIERIIGVY